MGSYPVMKLLVFPEARRDQVESVVRETLGIHAGGTSELTLTIVRLARASGWTVHATGLGDPVLERTYCDVIEEALKSSGI
jgi:hypothetical protein